MMQAQVSRIPPQPLRISVLGVCALAGLLLGFASPAQADDDPTPCAAKSFEFKEVKRACVSGGRKAAKKMMQAAVKRAKAAGESMNCKFCHTDVKEKFDLKPNAVADLRPWL